MEMSAMSTEVVVQIVAPHFTAGIVMRGDRVVEAAPIVGYMRVKRWTRGKVKEYCAEKGWKATVVSSKWIADE